MSIGIITYHSAHNYGAMLQAYALQQYIKKHVTTDVKTIDFRTEEAINAYKIFRKPRRLRGYVWEFLKLLHLRELIQHYKSFEIFLEDYIDKTERYDSLDSLRNNPPNFEIYISGSDQVFSPKGKELDACYLNFGHKNVKRVAYAPSFGYKTVPEDKKNIITKLLNEFDYLSAREKSGCKIIKELTGKDVPHVLDPVFLLEPDYYHKIAMPVGIKYDQYILCYSLVGLKKQLVLAKRLKKLTDLPIVLLKSSATLHVNDVDIIIRNAGPREFLWLFLNASYVLTDSFHGTAFSILFRKNFFSTIAFPEKAERIYSILNETGLIKRLIENVDEILKSNLNVDYNIPTKKIEQRIQISREFLNEALRC